MTYHYYKDGKGEWRWRLNLNSRVAGAAMIENRTDRRPDPDSPTQAKAEPFQKTECGGRIRALGIPQS